jgi:hypothetical protein
MTRPNHLRGRPWLVHLREDDVAAAEHLAKPPRFARVLPRFPLHALRLLHGGGDGPGAGEGAGEEVTGKPSGQSGLTYNGPIDVGASKRSRIPRKGGTPGGRITYRDRG